MSHSNSIFGKDLYQLDIDDIINFFSTPQEESSILEFKTGSPELEKIYKEVCAFLNTDGGILIIGSPEEIPPNGDKKKAKVCHGLSKPNTIIVNQDRLMHSIAANLSPSPSNIKAKTIPYNNGNIFVLEIQKSINPPHQVSNVGVYYIRVDKEAKPSPHGIVQALFYQRKPINLDFNLVLNEEIDDTFTLTINVTNSSDYPARQIQGFITIIGKVNEFENKDGKKEFKKRYIGNANTELTNEFEFPRAVVSSLWVWRNYFNLKLSEEYFYAQVYLWSSESPAIGKTFKVNSLADSVEINEDSEEYLEFLKWKKKTE